MSADTDFARLVGSWLHRELDASPDPQPVYDRVLADLPVTAQVGRRGPAGRPNARRPGIGGIGASRHGGRDTHGTWQRISRPLALGVLMILGIGALSLGIGLSPTPVPLVVPSPSSSSLPVPSSSQGGPVLTWERVEPGFEMGGSEGPSPIRVLSGTFVIGDRDGVHHSSRDGLAWSVVDEKDALRPRRVELDGAFDEPVVMSAINYSAPSMRSLAMHMPDGTVVEHTFRGPISMIAASRAVILVVENVTCGELIADVLGADAVDGSWTIVSHDRKAWQVRTASGELASIDLPRHGYWVTDDCGDRDAAKLAWRSTDGSDWTPIRDDSVVDGGPIQGTPGGFYRGRYRGQSLVLWYSADGLVWQELASFPEADVAWSGEDAWHGAPLLTVGDRLGLATPDGVMWLPISDAILGADGVLAASRHGSRGAGDLGWVAIATDQGSVVYSPDGSQWTIADAPAAWGTPNTLIGGPAVSDDAILVAVDQCSDPEVDIETCIEHATDTAYRIETLWRGAVYP